MVNDVLATFKGLLDFTSIFRFSLCPQTAGSAGTRYTPTIRGESDHNKENP